ncbi:hypothetical protein [uncultured Megasphaera sp.]|uniref:hypothetical protein n=1 Tax=uncultured Megasphaera sp. TaxID=165188 RepID=UPI00265A4CFE|nr:hypothetical protein [uncultured Megasphaera sp.]
MADSLSNVKMLIQAATGYEVQIADDALLNCLLQAEQQAIVDDCNLDALPAELEPVVEERTAGKFLQLKKSAVLNEDDASVVTRIEEGDTTVQFEGTSAESRLDSLISSWLRERDLACYRRLRW